MICVENCQADIPKRHNKAGRREEHAAGDELLAEGMRGVYAP